MTQEAYGVLDYDVFVGIDTSRNSFAVTVLDHYGLEKTKKIPSDPENLHQYIQRVHSGKKVLYGYEAGPTGYGLRDYLRGAGERCMVIAPYNIGRGRNERVKTDRIDSKKIATVLRAAEVKEIRVPEGAYRELRHLVKIRESYSKLQTQSKLRIKSILLLENLYIQLPEEGKRWSNRFIRCLEQFIARTSTAASKRIAAYMNDLKYSRQQLSDATRELKIYSAGKETIRQNLDYIESIPGIGFITAVTILSSIGDPKGLRGVREMGSFCGLVPCERSSGEQIRRGEITHTGSRRLRTLLVESAWIAIQKDVGLRRFFESLYRRSSSKQKAIVAVARKLSMRICSVLRESRPYKLATV